MTPGVRNGKCQICRHPERQRIEWLAAQGTTLLSLARQFDVQRDAVYRHIKNHVDPAFLARVKLGPFKSEDELRRLCSEQGTSVIESLLSIYHGLSARWLIAFEAGADNTLALLTDKMQSNLALRSRIAGELRPAPASITQNNLFISPAWATLESALLRVLAHHPDARADVIRELRKLETAASAPQIEGSTDGRALPAA